MIGVTFNNTGTVNVERGILTLAGGGETDGGTFNISLGETLNFSNSHTLKNGTQINGDGNLQITGGIVDLQLAGGTAIADTVELTIGGGTFEVDGNWTLPNKVNWNGGTLKSPGIITSSDTLTIGDSDTKFLDTQLNNTGTIVENHLSNRDLIFQDEAVLNNSGNYELQRGEIRKASNSIATFNNSGTLRKTTTRTGLIGVTFNNTGTVNIERGILNFNGTYTHDNADLIIKNGDVNFTDSLILNGGSLEGNDDINVAVTNSGLLNPAHFNNTEFGRLIIEGNYTETDSASINIQLGGYTAQTNFDQIDIDGIAEFRGTLNVSLLNDFTPNLGDSFDVLTFNSRTSSSELDFTGLEINSNLQFRPEWFDDKLTLTVVNSEPLITISDVSLLEGDSGTTDFVFDVALSKANDETITVDYTTADDTAVTGGDYTATTDTLTFNAGETSKTVTVSVTGDTIVESDETFFVNLSNPTNATISDSQGVGTIRNDDGTPPPLPIVTISDVSALEGDSGTTNFTFTVNLSTTSTETIALDFSTADGLATDNSATAGIDYTATSGTLTFNPGETSKTIDVSVIGDTTVESDETFSVNLNSVTNAIISDAEGIGTIDNDDGTRVDTELSLLVDISESIDNQEYKTQIEGYIAAFNNENLFNDFIGEGINKKAAVNLVVWAGEDQIQEVVGWTLIDSVTASQDFATAIGDALLPESGGSRPFDGATAPGDAIDFAVPLFSSNIYDGRRWKIDLSADGKWNDGVNPATARDNALAAGVDAINAIVVSDDQSVVEFYEDNLIGGSGAFILQTNDFTGFEASIYQKLRTELTPLPLLSISDVSLQEGDNGTTDFVFDVTLSETSTEAIAVDFTTVDGTAVAENDYTATSGTLNFAAGETSKQVTVSVTGENRLEIDENFFVNLSNATNAEIGDNQGEGTILNDDEIQLRDDNGNVVIGVDENSLEGTVIAILTASDSGDSDGFTFTLVGDGGGHCIIVGNELRIVDSSFFDFEINSSFTVTIRATNINGITFDQTFTININDVNEGPSFGAVFNIEENSREGDFVGQLGATDPEGDTLEYAITGGNIDPDGDGTAAFAIDSATGRITVADSGDLDFETTPIFNLNLAVTDTKGLSDNARITINLADVDESLPVNIENTTFSVEENSEEETVVGVVRASASSNEAVLSIIENEPPTVDDAIFELEENSDDEAVVGTVTATDPETEALNFAITSGNLDPDNDNKQAFAIDALTGAIIVNDSDDIDFETTPTFNLEVLATDPGGLSDTADIAINLIDVPTVEFAEDNSQNGFFALDGGESKNLKFTVDEVETNNINEVGLFIVDDENGNINGIAADSPDYLQAALERSQVIVSAISDIPSGFNLEDIERILEVDSNRRFGFYMASNASTDEVLTQLQSTGTTNSSVFFSNSSNMRVADLDTDSFTIEWSEQAFSNNLTDIALNVELSSQPPAVGTKLQRETQQELIDLSDVTDPVSVEVQVHREADQDNLIGFYQITDISGGIDIDGDGVADINPGDAGYKEAALTNRITGLDLLQTENQQTTSFNGSFDGDSILAPFIIVDGTLDEALDNTAETYFSFLGANSDGVDHIRLLGDNIFGFEDLVSGGDFDFNDVIVEIDIPAV